MRLLFANIAMSVRINMDLIITIVFDRAGPKHEVTSSRAEYLKESWEKLLSISLRRVCAKLCCQIRLHGGRLNSICSADDCGLPWFWRCDKYRGLHMLLYRRPFNWYFTQEDSLKLQWLPIEIANGDLHTSRRPIINHIIHSMNTFTETVINEFQKHATAATDPHNLLHSSTDIRTTTELHRLPVQTPSTIIACRILIMLLLMYY